LILALLLVVPFQWGELKVSGPLLTAGEWLARMTLPLALLGIGGSLSGQLKGAFASVPLQATVLKLLVLPGLIMALAVAAGFRGAELGVLVLMFSSPTAAASFAMAKAMGRDAILTAQVIALSTLGSLFTISAFLYILFYYALI